MKGISMPINIIVIIAIAVLVLIVVSAFLMNAFGGSSGQIGTEAAFQDGCARLLYADNCKPTGPVEIRIANFDPYATGSPLGETLWTACKIKFNDQSISEDQCRAYCGCNVQLNP
ncbi:hypothetical protein ACFLQN_03545 [Candidatus Aenigmatarchaeota archaeon]